LGQLPIQLPIRGPRELPARRPLLRFVGEAHDVPDRFLIEITTGRDLLVDLEGEDWIGVADLCGDPLRVSPGDRCEGRPRSAWRVRRDRWQCPQTALRAIGVGAVDGAAQDSVAEAIAVAALAAIGPKKKSLFSLGRPPRFRSMLYASSSCRRNRRRIPGSCNARDGTGCHARPVSLRCVIVDDNALFLAAARAVLEGHELTARPEWSANKRSCPRTGGVRRVFEFSS